MSTLKATKYPIALQIRHPGWECRLLYHAPVNIQFTSTLTAEDEHEIAPAIMTALSAILDLLPIAYRIRIETRDSQVYQISGPSPRQAGSIAIGTSPAPRTLFGTAPEPIRLRIGD